MVGELRSFAGRRFLFVLIAGKWTVAGLGGIVEYAVGFPLLPLCGVWWVFGSLIVIAATSEGYMCTETACGLADALETGF